MTCGIYKITNNKNGHSYIGSSCNIENRLSGHRRKLITNRHINRHLQGAWNTYGESCFDFSVIEECEIDLLIEREQYFINTICPKYNIRLVAESNRGLVTSKETREKLSNAMKGRIFTQEWKDKISKSKIGNKAGLGKICSQERKDKLSKDRMGIRPSDNTYKGLSEYNKNHIVSKETREKLSKLSKGRIVSQETKDKQRIAMIGRKHTQETKDKLSKKSMGNKNSLGKEVPQERRDKISKTLKIRNALKRLLNGIRQTDID